MKESPPNRQLTTHTNLYKSKLFSRVVLKSQEDLLGESGIRTCRKQRNSCKLFTLYEQLDKSVI
jgi:hypothetical protein